MQNSIGNRLRQWRKDSSLKGYQLARKIGMSQGSLSDIENNNSLPSSETLIKLYTGTDLNIVWLLMGEGSMNRDLKHSENGKNQDLQELINLVVKVYNRGDNEKLAHLSGFLQGAAAV